MADVEDVAAYILQSRGPMTAMKLQKLCYYAHAWHLVWDEEPLFADRIEAWANGPVVRNLYRAHRGRFSLGAGDVGGDVEALKANEIETINAVLDFYGGRSAHELSEMTHRERPWRDARAGLAAGERGEVQITDDMLFEYYDGLTASATE